MFYNGFQDGREDFVDDEAINIRFIVRKLKKIIMEDFGLSFGSCHANFQDVFSPKHV